MSIATLAWTIYNDQRSRTLDPKPDAVVRQIRITLRERDIPLPGGGEHITEIVATEIIRHASRRDDQATVRATPRRNG